MDKEVLKKTAKACQIPFTVYKDGQNLLQYPDPDQFQSAFDQEKQALSQLAETLAQYINPVVFMEDTRIYYSAFQYEESIFILGPAAKNRLYESDLLAFRHKHRLKVEAMVPRHPMNIMRNIASLFCYLVAGISAEPEDIPLINVDQDIAEWDIEEVAENYELNQSEHERDHASFAFEKELLDIVREGNVEKIEHLLQGRISLEEEHIGVVADSFLKRTEYLCVSLLTLLPRAAVEGGLSTEKAYSMADLYLQKLEKCKSAEKMFALTGRAQYEFTEKVREARAADSRMPYIEDCKNYIAKNLRRPFQVGDIAPAIGINRSYLARRFSEVEGITIQQYIQKERCTHAANLLKYSDYSISLIAEYFCFSSQSHFGRAFKEFYGMTPKEFRNRNKRRDSF